MPVALRVPSNSKRAGISVTAGHRFAAGFVQNNARGWAFGAGFKAHLTVRHLSEELFLAFGKQFELGPGYGLAIDVPQNLREEAAAVAGDLESALSQPIAPSVVIEELRINRNLGALLGSLDIGERQLRVQDMHTDVIDARGSKSIGQHNRPGMLFRIVSGP